MPPDRLTQALIAAWSAVLLLHPDPSNGQKPAPPEEVPYGVAPAPWPEQLGNHRARIRVSNPAGAVRVHVPWRRHDADPEKKATLIYEASTGQQIRNVVRWRVDREAGDFVFEPRATGEYWLYYFTFDPRPQDRDKVVVQGNARYAAPVDTADPAWLKRHRLDPECRSEPIWESLPLADVIELEARSDFDSFYLNYARRRRPCWPLEA